MFLRVDLVNVDNNLPVVANEFYDMVGNTQLQVATAQTVTPFVFLSGSVLSNDSDIDGPAILVGKNGDPNGVTNNGPTAGVIAFNNTLTSTSGTDGIIINDLDVGASIDFSGGTVDIDSPPGNGITLSNNAGSVTFDGGTIDGAGGDAINSNSSVLSLSNFLFGVTILNTGDTVDVTGSTLSGATNFAVPFSCTDGGGNTGSISFNAGINTCP